MQPLPLKMHTPFSTPIYINERGRDLPQVIRTPAEAYVALDGHGPGGLTWALVRSSLTTMRREPYDDLEAVRWQLASALWIDGILIGH